MDNTICQYDIRKIGFMKRNKIKFYIVGIYLLDDRIRKSSLQLPAINTDIFGMNSSQ